VEIGGLLDDVVKETLRAYDCFASARGSMLSLMMSTSYCQSVLLFKTTYSIQENVIPRRRRWRILAGGEITGTFPPKLFQS
jgi:hypothetical protein